MSSFSNQRIKNRSLNGETLTGFFNFSSRPKTVAAAGEKGREDLLTGAAVSGATVTIPGYGFFRLKNR